MRPGIFVSVPLFGDSFFIILDAWLNEAGTGLFPSPYSGILFLYLEESEEEKERKRFPSPYSGILFLFGDYSPIAFFIRACFRPLIRGFFFYKVGIYHGKIQTEFPSPYSGILFLLITLSHHTFSLTTSFRPLIRGFFFYGPTARTA